MAWSNLARSLRLEIAHYLDTPYAKNSWSDLHLVSKAAFAGKGTWQQIKYATACALEKSRLPVHQASLSSIRQIQRRYHIGIDCSGLVYHLLDHIDRHSGGEGIYFKIINPDQRFGQFGPRAISADCLTSDTNSLRLRPSDTLQIGDLIRFDQGRHIMLITSATRRQITYIHSSQHTKVSGVHYATITITQPHQGLGDQLWSDQTKSSQSYTSLFFPHQGDGIYRPRFLASKKLPTFPLSVADISAAPET